jgi:hypothetical protein
MTVKEDLHRLVEELPASQFDEARQRLEDLRDSSTTVDDEPLTEEDRASVERGMQDIRAGRVKTLDQYERERGL